MSIADLRSKIASGAIKPRQGGGGGAKVGEGVFHCLVEKASYEAGNNGNKRGLVVVKVVGGPDATPATVGGLINIYMQTVHAEFAGETVALWAPLVAAIGVSEDKLYDDADDVAEVIQNLTNILNKTGVKKGMQVVLKRKEQPTPDPKSGKARYYNDILLEETLALIGAQDSGAASASESSATPAAPERKKQW